MGSKTQLKNLQLPNPSPIQPVNISTAARKVSSVVIILGWNEINEQHEILLTKRTQLVETHKGQISFPGGFYQDGDGELLNTALRELEEECGANRGDLEVIGSMNPVETRNQVMIYPWVASMKFPYSFRVNPHEVERLLYLPVNELIEVGLKTTDVSIGTFTVKSPGIYVDNELVWGATAKMLETLREYLIAAVTRP